MQQTDGGSKTDLQETVLKLNAVFSLRLFNEHGLGSQLKHPFQINFKPTVNIISHCCSYLQRHWMSFPLPSAAWAVCPGVHFLLMKEEVADIMLSRTTTWIVCTKAMCSFREGWVDVSVRIFSISCFLLLFPWLFSLWIIPVFPLFLTLLSCSPLCNRSRNA